MLTLVILRNLKFGVLVGVSALLSSSALSQNFNPPYPRIGQLTFYSAGAGDEIWKNHDLIAIRHHKTGDARRIKAKNPDVILLGANDLIDDQTGAIQWPAAWRARYADGSFVSASDNLPNTTDWCPKVDFGFGPQRYNEWLPQYLNENTDWNYFDGSFFDSWHSGIWHDNPQNVDWDLDGVADGGLANARLIEGNRILAERLRAISSKPVVTHESGTSEISYLNGNGYEDWTEEGWIWTWSNHIRVFGTEAVEPRISILEITVNGNHTNYSRVRAGVATACLAGIYVGVDEGVGAHRWTFLYDEFEANLGYPTSQPQKLRDGVWVRFFDEGAVIVNGSGTPVTVADGDLRTLTGYDNSDGDGYFRFRGSQDPSFNNGQEFTSVTLVGEGGGNSTVADGILLFRKPTILVTPIIVDNVARNMTSVDQQPVSYSGAWIQYEEGNVPDGLNSYALDYGWDRYGRQFAYTSSSGTATYNFSIKLPGEYEVFEWHPDVQAAGLGSGCSSVSVTVNHAEGQSSRTVNQSTNSGRWNSLGTYSFNGSASVELRGSGGCTSASDAIRFVHKDSSTVADSNAPDSPKGINVEQSN